MISVEQVRLGPGGAQKVPIKPMKPKLFLTDGTEDPIHGICVFFIRCNVNKAITNVNINNVKYCLILRNSLTFKMNYISTINISYAFAKYSSGDQYLIRNLYFNRKSVLAC